MQSLKILAAMTAVRSARAAANRLKTGLIWYGAGAILAVAALVTFAVAVTSGLTLLLPPDWPDAAAPAIVGGVLTLAAVICFIVSKRIRSMPAAPDGADEIGEAARLVGEAVGASAADLGRSAKDAATSKKGRTALFAAALIAVLAAGRKL